MIAAVERIIAIETNRGEIARRDRSELASAAQPYQDLIDLLLYQLAGISDLESKALEQRLENML
jgi:hypothetical protein